MESAHHESRREFIGKVSAAAAMGFFGSKGISNMVSGPAYKSALPAIKIGNYKISRLVCGSNPLLGYSYLGSHTDRHMKEYFTPEQTVEFLLSCEKAGITTHQCSSRFDYIPLLRDKGSNMQIICLSSSRETLREEMKASGPIAMVHHGGVTDRLFSEGKAGVVHDFVKSVKDNGLLAGVSAHNPDVVKTIADEGWEVDFFMTCFYYLTRSHDIPYEALPTGGYSFFRNDPDNMTKVVRQVKQPCLGFKILGAGRKCSSQEEVKNAFKYAFDNIKPSDGVIVGMFPWYFDEIGANAQYTRELAV